MRFIYISIINNDGLADLVEMDMDPADNYRKKLLMSGYNYLNYQNNDLYGYQYQYVRNTLQLNLGPRVISNDTLGDPVFSDIGFYAGISSTDWSWAPVVQDFDNDGLRDIIITNGFPKDLTDHDFIAFREKSFANKSKREVLEAIPKVKIKNYAFRNRGNVQFANVTNDWGFTDLSFSNAAAYADLDNDGDLDVVISNINDKAFIYQNKAVDDNEDSTRFLAVTLTGDSLNRQGIGTWVEIYSGGKHQIIEQSPYRGFLSTIPSQLHFGLGAVSKVDSVVVIWPNHKKQIISNIPAGQTLNLRQENAKEYYDWKQPVVASKALFKDITDELDIHYLHHEKDFIDFNVQKLIPHKLSEYTPVVASGDLNNDGFDDIVIGGSFGNGPTLLFQNSFGKFTQQSLLPPGINKDWEATGIALFDGDSDHDLDIYIACGSNEAAPNTPAYQDKLFINDGRGHFALDLLALPPNQTSKSCVRVSDFDKDGDPDLFIGGRSFPWSYPMPVSSILLRNDQKNGEARFTDVTQSIAGSLAGMGMVCDAVWSDYDKDGWTDLLIAGEWMPLKFLKNDHGKFIDVSGSSGIGTKSGWWNCISNGDFDHDGDDDYIVGNLGENSFYKASDTFPVAVYANDFYNQGRVQCIVTLYLKENADGVFKEFTAHTRDDVVEQLPFIKKRFLTYAEFGKASFDKLFTKEELLYSRKYEANYLTSSLVRNNGNGNFSIEPLPAVAQFSAINTMVVDDYNKDGHLDIFMNTNDFGTDPSNGRYDALNGLILQGDGKGNFKPLTILQSGIYIPGNGKGLAKLKSSDGNYLLVASQNKGRLKVFRLKTQD
jgi:hypothetical protein